MPPNEAAPWLTVAADQARLLAEHLVPGYEHTKAAGQSFSTQHNLKGSNDEQRNRLGSKADAERPESGAAGLERTGDVPVLGAGIAVRGESPSTARDLPGGDGDRLQPPCGHANGGRQDCSVAVLADGSAGNGLGDRGVSKNGAGQQESVPTAPYDYDALLAELDAKREELSKLWEPDEWPRESAAHAGRAVRSERLAARIEELKRIINSTEGA